MVERASALLLYRNFYKKWTNTTSRNMVFNGDLDSLKYRQKLKSINKRKILLLYFSRPLNQQLISYLKALFFSHDQFVLNNMLCKENFFDAFVYCHPVDSEN